MESLRSSFMSLFYYRDIAIVFKTHNLKIIIPGNSTFSNNEL